eukprot:scaffold62239_cov49-Attheya_sp.AAC.3
MMGLVASVRLVRLFIARCAQYAQLCARQNLKNLAGNRDPFFPPPTFSGLHEQGGAGSYCFHSEFDSITFRFASISTIDSARNNRIAEGNDHSGSHSIPGQDIVVHKSSKQGESNQPTIQYQSRVKRASIENKMPTRVTFRVKRGSSLPFNERVKKQRMTNVPRIRVKSNHGASGSCRMCEPSSDPDLSHSASTSSSSATSKQFTPQVGNSDNADMCAFEGSLKGDLVDSLSNQDNKNPPMNNVFSELPSEEELEYEEVAQNSIAHGPAAIPFKINGHANVPRHSGRLGSWVSTQRTQYHRLKEGKHSHNMTNERRDKLESIGFVFVCPPSGPPWDQRFQELVDFQKINGHANVPTHSGRLGTWVRTQRTQYHRLKEGRHSHNMTNERRDKLESIGFVFVCPPSGPPWDQRFQELVDFQKINGHANVPTRSGRLGAWVSTQRSHYNRLKEGKQSYIMTNERREKLESLGFCFIKYI